MLFNTEVAPPPGRALGPAVTFDPYALALLIREPVQTLKLAYNFVMHGSRSPVLLKRKNKSSGCVPSWPAALPAFQGHPCPQRDSTMHITLSSPPRLLASVHAPPPAHTAPCDRDFLTWISGLQQAPPPGCPSADRTAYPAGFPGLPWHVGTHTLKQERCVLSASPGAARKLPPLHAPGTWEALRKCYWVH